MKIKEKDEQHMVIESTTGERLWGVLPLILLIIYIFVFSSASPGLSFFVIILVWIIICLYFAGKMFTRRIVFNRPTDSVILEARHFMLIHKKRFISLSAVTGVSIERKIDWSSMWGGWGGPLSKSLQVSIFIGDKGIKIDSSSNEMIMAELSSQISAFIKNNPDR